MPVRLHYTWAIVALLGIPVLSGVTIPVALPTMGGVARVLLAVLILALFFGAVALHEGAHLLVAHLLRVHYGALNGMLGRYTYTIETIQFMSTSSVV
ncbi:MAG: hypothetical protein M3R61_01065 [Chloroflexota bacterium]|nr:hypothetical protein [Chloroflexota bacterium]